jgi:Circularly permuted ATP-grasp type 2
MICEREGWLQFPFCVSVCDTEEELFVLLMTQLTEAIARYHRLLESEEHRDSAWVESLLERMKAQGLFVSGRPVSPFLRPHFLSARQYLNLTKAAEALFCAINRVKQHALSNPALLSRMELLPAEKMLAQLDPGYPYFAVASLLDTSLNNGTLHFVDYEAEAPVGLVYGEALANLYLDTPVLKEFRKRYALTKMGGVKQLLHSLLKAYKEFGGKKKPPNIAIVEFKQPFQTLLTAENQMLAEAFRKVGLPAEVVPVDQLEYRGGVLRRGDFAIDLVYRRLKAQEFLVRYDLTHPLVRAYRERTVCMVNSFRSELARKKAIFDLLTDDAITGNFPLAERKAIRDFIPWTRVVAQRNVTYRDQTVDLLDFVLQNREKLVLKPNDDSGEYPTVLGWETDAAAWERALRNSLRNPYVVQERIEPTVATFPLWQYGRVEMRQMQVEIHPHAFLGKVDGCSSWLTEPGRFSTLSGLAPTFVLEAK